MEILNNLNKLHQFWHKRVLFVCSGNICRSAAADGMLRQQLSDLGLSDKIYVDSVGTHGFHQGEAPDPRTIAVAEEDGINIKFLRARKITAKDFEKFDIIYAMDHGHYEELHQLKPSDATCEIEMYLETGDVPDPWYGEKEDFYIMYDIIKERMPHIIKSISAGLEETPAEG